MLVDTEDLIAFGDLRLMFGVSRQRVDQLTRSVGFPRPIVTRGGLRLWLRRDIAAWTANRRTMRPVAQ